MTSLVNSHLTVLYSRCGTLFMCLAANIPDVGLSSCVAGHAAAFVAG